VTEPSSKESQTLGNSSLVGRERERVSGISTCDYDLAPCPKLLAAEEYNLLHVSSSIYPSAQ
jgi:hypothetical protein